MAAKAQIYKGKLMTKKEIKKLNNKELVIQFINHAHTFGGLIKETEDFANEIICRLEQQVKPAKTGQRKIKNIFNKIMSKKQLLPADNLPDYLRDAIMPKDVVEIAKKYGIELEYDE